MLAIVALLLCAPPASPQPEPLGFAQDGPLGPSTLLRTGFAQDGLRRRARDRLRREPDASVPPSGAPRASEVAKLYFLAGDVRKAVEWCTHGLKAEPKVCKPMITALAEYGYLASKRDQLTNAEARAFLEWDRAISPTVPSKLTEPTIARLVVGPLQRAHALAGTDQAQARKLVKGVLEVDPKNADALGLSRELGADGGAPQRDAGAAGPAKPRPRAPRALCNRRRRASYFGAP